MLVIFREVFSANRLVIRWNLKNPLFIKTIEGKKLSDDRETL
jgi:hypothetical protein